MKTVIVPVRMPRAMAERLQEVGMHHCNTMAGIIRMACKRLIESCEESGVLTRAGEIPEVDTDDDAEGGAAA